MDLSGQACPTASKSYDNLINLTPHVVDVDDVYVGGPYHGSGPTGTW